MCDQTVTYRTQGQAAWITLDVPERRNALSEAAARCGAHARTPWLRLPFGSGPHGGIELLCRRQHEGALAALRAQSALRPQGRVAGGSFTLRLPQIPA